MHSIGRFAVLTIAGQEPQGVAGSTWADWLVLGMIALALILVFRRHPWLSLLLHGRGGGHGSSGGE